MVGAWFRELEERGLGPRWIARVAIDPTCGWDLRSWIMAAPPPRMRRFPSATAGPVLPLGGPCDVWHADEEPGHALEAHHWVVAIGRNSEQKASPDVVATETAILRALATDASLKVVAWQIWAMRAGHQDVVAGNGNDAASLAEYLGELRPAAIAAGAPRLPAATLSSAGVTLELDDEQWLTWAWIQLLNGKRDSPLEKLLSRGGSLRGDRADDLRALIALVRSRLAAPPPPILPAAWKQHAWQEAAIGRLRWMLEHVWKAARPPALAELLSHLDAFARRAKEESASLDVTVRDGLGPTRYGNR